jgi:spore coat polysaccharide biosynthesis predicted glycosyltransferase SpsG
MTSNSQQHILLLTEAGANIGLGHVMRCVAIAASFRANGHHTDILVDVSGSMPELIAPDVVAHPWRRNPVQLPNTLHGVDQVVIDSYLADVPLYATIAQHATFSVAIDDFDRIVYPVDLVINPNPFALQMDYGGQHSEVIGGNDFVILRPEFLPYRNAFEIDGLCSDLFVTVGGNDYRDLLSRLVPALAERDYQLRVVAGDRTDALRTRCAGHEHLQLFDHLTASEMAQQMIRADAAISAAGQTLHELSFLGIPTLGICVDGDQDRNIAAYARTGFLPRSIYWNQDDLIDTIWTELKKLSDFEVRRSRSTIGQRIVDGHGPARIREAILKRAL